MMNTQANMWVPVSWSVVLTFHYSYTQMAKHVKEREEKVSAVDSFLCKCFLLKTQFLWNLLTECSGDHPQKWRQCLWRQMLLWIFFSSFFQCCEHKKLNSSQVYWVIHWRQKSLDITGGKQDIQSISFFFFSELHPSDVPTSYFLHFSLEMFVFWKWT